MRVLLRCGDAEKAVRGAKVALGEKIKCRYVQVLVDNVETAGNEGEAFGSVNSGWCYTVAASQIYITSQPSVRKVLSRPFVTPLPLLLMRETPFLDRVYARSCPSHASKRRSPNIINHLAESPHRHQQHAPRSPQPWPSSSRSRLPPPPHVSVWHSRA